MWNFSGSYIVIKFYYYKETYDSKPQNKDTGLRIPFRVITTTIFLPSQSLEHCEVNFVHFEGFTSNSANFSVIFFFCPLAFRR